MLVKHGETTDQLRELVGEQSFGGASCRISKAENMPEWCRWVSHVRTEPEARRKGDATRLMTSLIAQADGLGFALVLHPRIDEDGALDQAGLERWYRRLGFVTIQARPLVLATVPPKPQGI